MQNIHHFRRDNHRSFHHGINNSIEQRVPIARRPRLSDESINHSLRSPLVALSAPFLRPPSLFSFLRRAPDGRLFVFVAVKITPIALRTSSPVGPEVLAKMSISLFARDLLPTDVAHRVATVADQLVAARRFDEAE